MSPIVDSRIQLAFGATGMSRDAGLFERSGSDYSSSRASVCYHNRDVSSRFGSRLRELRKSRNLTQLQMAVNFGIDRSYISDVERGRKSISLPTLEVIALGLEVSLSDLLHNL